MRIEEFDALPAQGAAAALEVCVRIGSWVEALLAARPYGDASALLATARAQARTWTVAEIDAALADHPRIGERPTTSHGGAAGSAHSRTEQAGVDAGDADLAERLRAGNADYEDRFDRIYLVRAKGRTGEELATLLEQRLANPPGAEQRVVHEQLAQIALLRLAELVDVPLEPASFDAAPVLPALPARPSSPGAGSATVGP